MVPLECNLLSVAAFIAAVVKYPRGEYLSPTRLRDPRASPWPNPRNKMVGRRAKLFVSPIHRGGAAREAPHVRPPGPIPSPSPRSCDSRARRQPCARQAARAAAAFEAAAPRRLDGPPTDQVTRRRAGPRRRPCVPPALGEARPEPRRARGRGRLVQNLALGHADGDLALEKHSGGPATTRGRGRARGLGAPPRVCERAQRARSVLQGRLSFVHADQFTAWPYFASWLKLIGGERVALTYEPGIGFGLRARSPFKKGERVIPGRGCGRVLECAARSPDPSRR